MQASSANASQIVIAVDTGDKEPLSGKEARQSGQPKGGRGGGDRVRKYLHIPAHAGWNAHEHIDTCAHTHNTHAHERPHAHTCTNTYLVLVDVGVLVQEHLEQAGVVGTEALALGHNDIRVHEIIEDGLVDGCEGTAVGRRKGREGGQDGVGKSDAGGCECDTLRLRMRMS